MVTDSFTFKNFAYFDTNIYSHLAKNPKLWSPLCRFLLNNDLCFSFSSANFVELAPVIYLHSKITDLILNLPSAVLKPWDTILNEEIASHPILRNESLDLDRIIRLAAEQDGRKELEGWFKSEEIMRARMDQQKFANLMGSTIESSKKNFKPSKSGKYERKQANEFTEIIVLQWLAGINPEFLKQFQFNASDLNFKCFQSIRIFGLVLFYKYYLGNRCVNNPSDFGDLAHLCFIPYCELVIIEKDLCNILNQIKKHHDILRSTRIENIDFLKKWIE